MTTPGTLSERRESVNFIRRLMQLSPDIVHIHDLRDQRILYVNHRLADILGYTEADLEALNHSLLSACIEPDSEQLNAYIIQRYAKATDGETVEYELTLRHKDGSTRVIRTRGNVFKRDAFGKPLEALGISEDITAERHTRNSLRRKNEQLEESQRLFHYGSWDWKAGEDRVCFSDELLRIFGYDLAEFPDGYAPRGFYLDHIPTEDRDRVQQQVWGAIDARIPYEVEHPIMAHDGTRKRLRLRGNQVFDKNGGLTDVRGIVADITAEYEASQTLRQTEMLLSQTEASLRFGSWEWDVPSNQITWSAGLFRIFGYGEVSESRPVTTSFFFQHIHPDDASRLRHITQEAFARPAPFGFEYRITDAHGQLRTLTGRGVPLFNEQGDLRRLVGNTIDVTEERQATELLRKQQLLLSEAESLLTFGSWEWDVPTGLILWSEGLYPLFGYGKDNRPDPLTIEVMQSHQHPDEVEQGRELYQRILTEKLESFENEFRILTTDGRECWMHQRGRVFFDETGQILRMMGSIGDVTALKKSKAELEQRLSDLNRSNADLEQFAYVASHDLQEPLRKIAAFAQRLDGKFHETLGADGRLYLERMLIATERMKGLIDNLLSFSRVTRKATNYEPTDLNAVLTAVLGDLELKIQETRAQITTDALPAILAVTGQMQQLFQNLLTNALKFSRAGVPPDIHIRAGYVSTVEKTNYGLNVGRKYVSIQIQDNGIGFEPQYAEQVFVIFQRLHGRADYEGTGIGLAICRKIVENHQGLIFAESQPGEGSIFTVILPA